MSPEPLFNADASRRQEAVYQTPDLVQESKWETLERQGGTITGKFRHPKSGGGFVSSRVQSKLTGVRLPPGTKVGVSTWRVPKGVSVRTMMNRAQLIEEIEPVSATLAVASRLMGLISVLGLVLDVYDYFTRTGPQMDQGWTPCIDPKTGAWEMPVTLCPPGSNVGPTA
jgi:hypothetical protein